MGIIDILIFVGFVAAVIGIGLYKSKDEKTHGEQGAQDYFLAGRGLTWWLVGFSLIAANISTEQFVGMSGKAADWLGMAIASYEWMAAITLVVVAFVFLPTFLKSGIYTIPEFLEYRYNPFARTIMAVSTLIILVGVPTASVIFSGAKVICVFFQGQTLLGLDLGNITVGCWIIGVLAAAYVFAGGLKACAWADLIQGSALILGGVIIVVLAMNALSSAEPTELVKTAVNPEITAEQIEGMGAVERFVALNKAPVPEGKLHMVRPVDDPEIPWTALIFFGLWIPNFFYWGLNQYITQRTLGSKSLDEGQKGIVFAAFLKLIIPFVVVIPGILALNLFSGDLESLAEKKNVPIIEKLDAGEKEVIPFKNDLPGVKPALAKRIVQHNIALVDMDAELPADADGDAIFVMNEALVKKAKDAKLTVSDKVIGYDHDAAFPTLLRNLLPKGKGLMGFVLAAIFGAVVSSLASMLNSAATIFTMDVYNKVKKDASQFQLVTMGRVCTVVFVFIALLIAPYLGSPKFGGIFTFIQEFQGFISPGILAIFVFGVLVKKAPRTVGTVGLLLSPVLYALCKWGGALTKIDALVWVASRSFLDRMSICFVIILVVLAVMTLTKPLAEPIKLPVNEKMDLKTSKSTKLYGVCVVVLTLVLYAIFW